MKEKLMDYLACPECEGMLSLASVQQEAEGEVVSGEIKCAGCGASYPIIDHIPRFVAPSNYSRSFGYQWNRFSKTQLDEYLGYPLSEERFKNETQWPDSLSGETVLEAGSGMGRFTRCVAGTGATVFTFDYSNAIDANFANNKHLKNVHFLQADIRKPPFRKKSFDKVFCFGVLQHTPNPQESFRSIFALVKNGGELVADVYRKTWKTLFWGQYYLRTITRRIPPDRLFPIVRIYFEIVHWFTGLLLPFSSHYSKVLSIVLGTADYRGFYPIKSEIMKEWCLLDTFDKLSPAFDQPQTISAVTAWIDKTSVQEWHVGPGYNGIEIHLRRKPAN